MTRMTSDEARERIAQRDRWEEICLSCSVPGVGQDHPRYYAARSLGALHHEWRAMVLKPMPAATAHDMERWAPLADYAREMRDACQGLDRARWEIVLACLDMTPQTTLESCLRSIARALTPGEDIDARADQDARAYCDAVVLDHQEAQS